MSALLLVARGFHADMQVGGVGRHAGLQGDIDLLAKTFGRPVVGIQNAT